MITHRGEKCNNFRQKRRERLLFWGKYVKIKEKAKKEVTI